jgi:hypothetical protein
VELSNWQHKEEEGSLKTVWQYVYLQNRLHYLGVVAQACNPSYSGGSNEEDHYSKLAQQGQNVSKTLSQLKSWVWWYMSVSQKLQIEGSCWGQSGQKLKTLPEK